MSELIGTDPIERGLWGILFLIAMLNLQDI
jgi:hypothetical protein